MALAFGGDKEPECKECEELFAIISQISTGCQVIEQKSKNLALIAYQNEWKFLQFREQIRAARKDDAEIDMDSLHRIVKQARQYLRYLETIDQSLDYEIKRADAYE